MTAANEPVDRVTALLWRECADVGMPRAVVVTKLDHARATTPGCWPRPRRRSEPRGQVLPLDVPVVSGTAVTGLVGLLAPADGGDPRGPATP